MIDALPLLLGPEGYQISRSVRLRSSASAYLNRTFGTPTNNRIWTWSAWVKRGTLPASSAGLFGAGTSGTNYCFFGFLSTHVLNFQNNASSGNQINATTPAVFRDPSAWYHVVLAVDTTQATNSNGVRIWVNGVQQTLTFSTYTQNTNTLINAASGVHVQGDYINGGAAYFDGYLTEINFIDGQALTPSSFGETNTTTGVWQPKKYAGTYGTNGFYLNFSDNSAATAAAIGKDYSGNGNNWTPNNISVTAGVTYDSMLDVPTQWADGGNGRGNYAVLNPLKNTASISSANLQTVNAASAGYYTSYATMSMDSGKYYWEISVVDDGVNSRYLGFGVADPSIALTGSTTSAFTGTQAGNARGWAQTVRSSVSVAGTGLYNNSSTVNSTTRTTASGTRIFMVAYDADTGKCWMGYEGTWWSGDPAAGTSQYFTATAPMIPVFNPYNDGSISTFATSANFGQRPFAYTPPTGFKALNTLNLPEPTILKGNQYFDVSLYSGTSAIQSVTNSGAMQPDLVWIKGRNTALDHNLYDAVRGATKSLGSNLTSAEVTNATTLTSFDVSGFTLGNNSSTSQNVNISPNTYVGWQWKEGATQGFDIVTYTGNGANRTIAHNLGVAPSMMIFKPRNAVDNWPVWHKSFAVNEYVYLNLTNAKASLSTFMNSTLPNSSDITLGTWANTNANTQTMVAYLFAEVAGFSRFGSYTGNGSTDGPFIFTGFLPRWLMIKSTGAADWYMWDTARNTYNLVADMLRPNLSAAELNSATYVFDFLSNGFKIRGTGSEVNTNGTTYVYACFASNPFKNALAR